MENPPDGGIAFHRRAQVREILEKINVTEKRIRKAFAGPGMFLHDQRRIAWRSSNAGAV